MSGKVDLLCELSDNTDIQPEEPNQRFHPAWGLNREPEPYRSVPNLEGASLSVSCFIQLGQDKIKLNLKIKAFGNTGLLKCFRHS